MIDWLRHKFAKWGWMAFEYTKRTKYINAGEYRNIRVEYTYNGDVEIAVSNNKPHKLIAILKVSFPNQNKIEFTKYLEYEDSLEPLVQPSGDRTT